MERLVANMEGRVTRQFKDGREYLVAPLSLIVPGVLPGSQGPLFYPDHEVAKNPSAWDGMPLLAYHPQSMTGEHVSANSAGIRDKQGIGFVQKSRIDKLKNGRLHAEGWFDVERTRTVNKNILDSLENNRPIELSTGLFIGRKDPAPPGANHNGRGYEWIARDYKPDHVAILPDQIGACSIRDGCGVLVNQLAVNSSGEVTSILNPGDYFQVIEHDGEILYRLIGNEANFASEAQRRFMWANHPDIAEEWAHGRHAGPKGGVKRMPTKTGSDVQGPEARQARKEQRKKNRQAAHNYFAGQSPDPIGQAAAVARQLAGGGFQSGGAGTTPIDPGKEEEKENKEGGETENLRGEGEEREAETKEPTTAKPEVQVKPPKAGSAQASSEIGHYQERLESGSEPAENEEATMNELNAFLLYNARWDQEARDKLKKEAPEDFAGPHESFPIKSQEDVDHAAHLIGHADDPEAVKSKIKSIAKRKGFSLPDSWEEEDDRKPAENVLGGSNQLTLRGGDTIMNAQLLQQLDGIITNCGSEASKTQLVNLRSQLTTNSPLKAPENMSDSELKDHHKRVVTEVAKRHAGMDDGDDTEASADDGYKDDDGDEGKQANNDGPMHAFDGPKGSGKSVQAGGAGVKGEYPKATENRSIEQWLRESKAPPAVRELINNAKKIDHDTKLVLCRQIVNNAQPTSKEGRQALGNILWKHSLQELQMIADSLNQQSRTVPNYFGAGAPAFNNSSPGSVPVENSMMIPVIDYKEMASPLLIEHLGK